MQLELSQAQCRDLAFSSRREWLLTNGLGGFAMGTAAGTSSRRYHGLLVAAVKPPTDRVVMLAAIEAVAQVKGVWHAISSSQYSGAVYPEGYKNLVSFACGAHAEWRYQAGPAILRQRIGMAPGENTVSVEYYNEGPEPALIQLKPLVSHKDYHGNFRFSSGYPHKLEHHDGWSQVTHDGCTLHLFHKGFHRTPVLGWYFRFDHPVESERCLDPCDDLYCPMQLEAVLLPGEHMHLTASTERQPAEIAFHPLEEAGSREALLAQAARHFVIDSPIRKSIIAGYPWFTDWGRDTMISLPGICLATGRVAHARGILRSYAAQMQHGLIPNRFVDHGETPDTNTVDATLWFANAIHLTLEAEWDEDLAREALGWLREVFDWHQRGTLFGIKVDDEDRLLTQGAPGVQLTWMDAKIGDWVVTPRAGKPVEINALWINLLRIAERLCERLDEDGLVFRLNAEKAESSFDQKFWRDSVGHYLDTADPDDATLRPNQVLAMGLPFSPMKGWRAERALSAVKDQLLTPRGLRTLGPNEMGYRPRFDGDMASRDSAYHQGTVWPWLLGSYIAAVLKITGDVQHCQAVLAEVDEMILECGIGGISEVYDASAPQRPGGCPWQAWSVAELLRAERMVKSQLAAV